MAADRFDVVIVGAGIVGVCIARELRARGARVAVIDRGEVGSGASHGNAGWVSPSHCMPIPQPGVIRGALRWLSDPESPFYLRPRLDLDLARWLARFASACRADAVQRTSALRRELAWRSLGIYARWAQELNLGFRQKGLLLVCSTSQGLEHAHAELRRARELGARGHELDARALRARVPALSEQVTGGVLLEDDAHLDPARCMLSLAQDLRQDGVEIQTQSELLGLHWTRRAGVRLDTARGALETDEVVLATGAWTPQLTARLGVRVLVQAAKGYSLTSRATVGGPSTPLLLWEARVAVTPLADRLRLAGTLELAGPDLQVAPRRVAAITRAARTWLPGLPEPEDVAPWCGLRPLTPDDLPIVGRPAGTRGLVLATGHGMSGMSQGPITGQLVAELLSGERPSMDLHAFSPDRFG